MIREYRSLWYKLEQGKQFFPQSVTLFLTTKLNSFLPENLEMSWEKSEKISYKLKYLLLQAFLCIPIQKQFKINYKKYKCIT